MPPIMKQVNRQNELILFALSLNLKSEFCNDWKQYQLSWTCFFFVFLFHIHFDAEPFFRVYRNSTDRNRTPTTYWPFVFPYEFDVKFVENLDSHNSIKIPNSFQLNGFCWRFLSSMTTLHLSALMNVRWNISQRRKKKKEVRSSWWCDLKLIFPYKKKFNISERKITVFRQISLCPFAFLFCFWMHLIIDESINSNFANDN